MTDLHFAWLEVSILITLLGALVVGRIRDPLRARHWSVVFSGLALIGTIGAWEDFGLLHAKEADDAWHLLSRVVGREVLVIDQLSAPLLPLTALLYFLTNLTTLRTKMRRFSFSWTLFSEAVTLAMLSCKEPWIVIALLGLGTLHPLLELRERGRSTRVFGLHMALFIGLLVLGWSAVESEGEQTHSLLAIVPLLAAVCLRSGMFPFHTWMTDLYENGTFGTALLFTTPIAGAYAAIRLVLPIAPDWVLRWICISSLLTAVYAAGMALVQREARRFFCFLFLSHSALVLAGLELVTPMSLTGALCVWLSAALALGGFGLTLRALEARRGRLGLVEFQGLYDHTPTLAACFLLTGLASVGFPGTAGFVGTELLVDGAVDQNPALGIAVVFAAALNSIAIVRVYFRLFTGRVYQSSVDLGISSRERFAVFTLSALLLLGGLFPSAGVISRHHAAVELLNSRGAELHDEQESKATTEATSPVGETLDSSAPGSPSQPAGK